MVVAKVWVTRRKPQGTPCLLDFKCIEESIPHCQDGDIIIEAEYFSVDPYIRHKIRAAAIDSTVTGSQVAKVIESKNEEYPVGTYVVGYPGWRTHTLLSQDQLKTSDMTFPYMKVPSVGGLSRSTALGVLGMPGNTAYFGFLEICKPQEGETVLVNGAAGAVGSYVCQIAKIKGCKVIAFAGSEEKVNWLKELGIDHVFNYKTTNTSEALASVAPEGIHCYFDNVGGQFTADALRHLADFARVSVCGCISTYNDDTSADEAATLTSPFNESILNWKQIRVEGFLVGRWSNRWMEGIDQMRKWIEQGKLSYKETITHGFDNVPNAFIGLFEGENFGKAIVTA